MVSAPAAPPPSSSGFSVSEMRALPPGAKSLAANPPQTRGRAPVAGSDLQAFVYLIVMVPGNHFFLEIVINGA